MWKTMTLVIALGLSACSTVNPYHPAGYSGDTGFSEQQLDSNRYRVTFRGDSSTTRVEVEDYLLFRAAELTDEKGYDYFIVSEQDVEAETRYTTVHRESFYGRYIHPRHDPYYYPYYAYGFDWGRPYDTEIRGTTRYYAEAYVALYRGVAPADNPRAFNAKSVMKNIGPIDCWKKEPHDEAGCKLDHSG